MSLIKVKAKVKLISEEDMEVEDMIEGVNLKSKRWVWRQVGIDAGDIYRIISYDSTKTLILLNDGEKLLSYEPFDDVFRKWNENMPEDLDLSDDGDIEHELSEDGDS